MKGFQAQLDKSAAALAKEAERQLRRDAEAIKRRLAKIGEEKELRKVFRNAMNAGARVVRDAAREKAAQRTGELSRKIIARSARTRSRSEHRSTVTINQKSPARFYAHLVELGTKPHDVKGRKHPGAKAQPFLRPAIDENREAVLKAVRERVESELLRRGV